MNVDHAAVCSKLIVFIKANLVAEGVDLDAKTSLTGLGLDSFSLIEILLFVERQFETVVPIEELNREKTETVDAIGAEVIYFMNKK
jgi:acyl carrier protein